jgi:ribosomal protein L4
MQVDVLNSKGAQTGRTLELPDDIFGVEPNDHCVYLAVKQYQAAQRQGTHKTKTRAEVHGSSKKLHRQKGTGGSRKGKRPESGEDFRRQKLHLGKWCCSRPQWFNRFNPEVKCK